MSYKNSIKNCLPDAGINDSPGEIVEGLSANQKYISSKYFYDENGSALFEKITLLQEIVRI